jgi:predicted  nucleic acid-binding Zn-ribbon protein
MRLRLLALTAILAAVPWLQGCYQCGNTAYLKALEKVGVEKRDLLVKRVDNAREAQEEAQQQFKDSLDEFRSLVGYDGGALEAQYEKLRSSYESSKSKADEVNQRIDGIESVANKLFAEWETEIGQFKDASYKLESQRELRDTRKRVEGLVKTMKKAASRMDPVLEKLNDQVMFLKHNLNAKALGSLKTTADSLQVEVSGLIQEMEASINEANAFIAEMKKPAASP